MRNKLAWFLILVLSLSLSAQDSTSVNDTRLKTVVYGGSGLYVATLIGLNHLWYANEPQSSFHFFNDNKEWLQVDKVGHTVTAFHISRAGVEIFEWAGLPRKKAILWGGLSGMIFQTPIEILDGFSSAYGASWGDIIANTAGSGMVMGQYYLWDELRIVSKFSFSRSPYAPQRPNILGSNLLEEILKDYNGQTYWFSANIYSFLNNETHFPKWLNVALGYGGQQMMFAELQDNKKIGLSPYRQIYLSLDVDLTQIKSKSKFLNTALFLVNTLKVPFPAFEFNQYGTKFYWLKF